MNRTLEAPFFKWYEKTSQKYLSVLKALYDFTNPPIEWEEEWETSDKEREDELKNSLSELDEMCSANHFITLQEFDRYSQLWQEVEENIVNAIKSDSKSYFYYLLRPFEPIMRAYTDESTEERAFISQCLRSFNLCVPGGVVDSIEIWEYLPRPSIDLFAFEFLSLVYECYNLNGVDFQEIANYYHFPIGYLSHYNLGKIVLSERDKGYKYFPLFDNRLYREKRAVQSDTVPDVKTPPELDTPQAREYLNRAQEAGFLDERYQPIKGFTNPQKKLFAAYCAVACNITERHWKLFEDLWNIKGLQKVKEEQGREAKAEAVAALFPHGIVDAAKKRFTLLI